MVNGNERDYVVENLGWSMIRLLSIITARLKIRHITREPSILISNTTLSIYHGRWLYYKLEDFYNV